MRKTNHKGKTNPLSKSISSLKQKGFDDADIGRICAEAITKVPKSLYKKNASAPEIRIRQEAQKDIEKIIRNYLSLADSTENYKQKETDPTDIKKKLINEKSDNFLKKETIESAVVSIIDKYKDKDECYIAIGKAFIKGSEEYLNLTDLRINRGTGFIRKEYNKILEYLMKEVQ